MPEKKKVIRIFLLTFAVLAIAAIIVITVLAIENKEKSERRKNASEQNNVISDVGEAVDLMTFFKDCSMDVDDNIYKKYKNISEEIFDNIFEVTLSSSSLGNLAVINSYFNLGKEEYIKDLFDKFYYEEYDGLKVHIGDDEVPEFYMYMFTLVSLKNSGIDLSEYNFDKKLADEFNKKIEKSGMNSDLNDIFWYFSYTDNINMIKYQKARDYFLKSYEIDEKKENPDYFSSVCTINYYRQLFDNDDSLKNKVNELYMSLNSDESFGFKGELGDLSAITQTLKESGIKEINKNKYLSDNADKLLEKVYNNAAEKSTDWLKEV